MYQLVSFEAVGLREAHVANLAFVGLLSCMGPQMPLELEGVLAGVRAVRALKSFEKHFIND